jgi:hypothetical protein
VLNRRAGALGRWRGSCIVKIVIARPGRGRGRLSRRPSLIRSRGPGGNSRLPRAFQLTGARGDECDDLPESICGDPQFRFLLSSTPLGKPYTRLIFYTGRSSDPRNQGLNLRQPALPAPVHVITGITPHRLQRAINQLDGAVNAGLLRPSGVRLRFARELPPFVELEPLRQILLAAYLVLSSARGGRTPQCFLLVLLQGGPFGVGNDPVVQQLRPLQYLRRYLFAPNEAVKMLGPKTQARANGGIAQQIHRRLYPADELFCLCIPALLLCFLGRHYFNSQPLGQREVIHLIGCVRFDRLSSPEVKHSEVVKLLLSSRPESGVGREICVQSFDPYQRIQPYVLEPREAVKTVDRIIHPRSNGGVAQQTHSRFYPAAQLRWSDARALIPGDFSPHHLRSQAFCQREVIHLIGREGLDLLSSTAANLREVGKLLLRSRPEYLPFVAG